MKQDDNGSSTKHRLEIRRIKSVPGYPIPEGLLMCDCICGQWSWQIAAEWDVPVLRMVDVYEGHIHSADYLALVSSQPEVPDGS